MINFVKGKNERALVFTSPIKEEHNDSEDSKGRAAVVYIMEWKACDS